MFLRTVTTIAALVFTAPAHALDIDPRAILSTGDLIPHFGAVGGGSFGLIGITDDGSVIVVTSTSDRQRGVYRVHDGNAEALWTVANDGPNLTSDGADNSPNGKVSIVGSQSLYRVDSDGGERIARRGDRDGDGNTLCSFGTTRIDDDGNVAFAARISDDEDCSTPRWAAFLFRGGETARILDAADIFTEEMTNSFIGIVDLPGDGSVTLRINNSALDRGLWTWRDGELSALITDTTLDPEGEIYISQAAVSGSTAAFAAGSASREPSIYRYRDGTLTTVLPFGELAPGGVRIETIQKVGVNRAGDITVDGASATFVFPNGAEPYAITAAGGGAINAAGDVAVDYWADRIALRSPGRRAIGVKPHGVDTIVTQIASGDPAPGGLRFATGGTGGIRCLGADGRLAVTVTAADGHTGLACFDADGPHLVAQGGSSTLDGGSIYEFDQCEVIADGGLLLGASELRPDPTSKRHYYLDWSVFRAGPTGIERVVGPGSETEDGATLKGLRSVVLVQHERVFAANAAGDVLVFGQAGHGMSLFLVTDGSIRKLGVPFAGGLGGRGTGWTLPQNPSIVRGTGAGGAGAADTDDLRFSLQDYVLTDDGSVVFIAEHRGERRVVDEEALFLFKEGELTRIASSQEDSGSLFNVPLRSLRYLQARGNRVAFSASSQGKHWYVFTTEAPTPVELAETDPAQEDSLPPHVVDFTADGRYLLGEWQAGTHLLVDGVLEALDPTGGLDGNVVSMNARDNLLISGGEGQLLRLSGPAPGAACDFPVPHENEPTVTPTPTITLTPTITWTRRPTWTPRDTWTPLPSATPVPPIACDDEDDCPSFSAASVEAHAGETIDVAVTVDFAGRSVAGLQFDVELPPAAVLQMSGGEPDCRTDVELDKEVYFAEQPSDCSEEEDCTTTLRVLVVSTTDVDVIDAGSVRFLCSVLLRPDAVPGSNPITISRVFLGTALGRKHEATIEDGTLTVSPPEPAPTGTPPQVAPTAPSETVVEPSPTDPPVSTDNPAQSGAVSGGGGDGCNVTGTTQAASWSARLLLLPFVLCWMLRRGVVRRQS